MENNQQSKDQQKKVRTTLIHLEKPNLQTVKAPTSINKQKTKTTSKMSTAKDQKTKRHPKEKQNLKIRTTIQHKKCVSLPGEFPGK